jgi:DNA-binding transcriptional LysR family regulator
MASVKPYVDLPLLMARFHRDHPKVELRVREIPLAEALVALRRRDVEIAIISPPDPIPGGLRIIRLVTDRYKFICGTDHRLSKEKIVRVVDMVGEPIVCLDRRFALRAQAESYLERAGIERHISCEVNSIVTVCELVGLGLGITILPGRIAEYWAENQGIRGIAIAELSPPGPRFEICCLVPVDQPGSGAPLLTSAARAFVAMLEGYLSATS